MNLRELNYILIPKSSEGVDDFLEHSRWAGLLGPFVRLLQSVTNEGALVFVATLIAAAAGIDVHFSHLYLVFCGLFGLLIAALICRPMARLPDVHVRIEHPPRISVGEVLNFTAVVRNEGDKARFALRVRGPFLPWDGTWIQRAPSIAVVEPGQVVRVGLAARLDVRGERYLGRFYGQSVFPLGLAGGQRVRSDRVRLTVVPRVLEVRGLPPPPAIEEPPEARGHSLHRGESFELLGLRPYRPGDRIRDLHARSWARLGEPMVREYRRATRHKITVLLDAWGDPADREGFDAAVDLTASLVNWGVQQEARVDLLVAAEPSFAMRIGQEGASLEAALDALAPVVACEDRPPIEALLGDRLGRFGRLLAIFATWDAERAAQAEQLRSHAPDCRILVVHRKRKVREAAREAGALTLDAGAMDAPLVLS